LICHLEPYNKHGDKLGFLQQPQLGWVQTHLPETTGQNGHQRTPSTQKRKRTQVIAPSHLEKEVKIEVKIERSTPQTKPHPIGCPIYSSLSCPSLRDSVAHLSEMPSHQYARQNQVKIKGNSGPANLQEAGRNPEGHNAQPICFSHRLNRLREVNSSPSSHLRISASDKCPWEGDVCPAEEVGSA
jgi:hypothetical protein